MKDTIQKFSLEEAKAKSEAWNGPSSVYPVQWADRYDGGGFGEMTWGGTHRTKQDAELEAAKTSHMGSDVIPFYYNEWLRKNVEL